MFPLIKIVKAAPLATNDPTGVAQLSDLEIIFERVVSFILGGAAIVLFILLVTGGFRYLTSGGDPKAIESAKKTLTSAIAGFIVLVLSFLILRIIEYFTGVNVTQFKIFQP